MCTGWRAIVNDGMAGLIEVGVAITNGKLFMGTWIRLCMRLRRGKAKREGNGDAGGKSIHIARKEEAII